ncbi:uncharacterized protein ISCGN_012580 [Ixodes scapularis]
MFYVLCFSRASVESPPDITDDDDDARFLGAITDTDMGALQRDDLELRAVINHLEGQESSVPRFLARDLSSFVLRRGVLFKKNFANSNPAWLLVVPASLREEIFQACHDDPTAGHLGYSRTLARIFRNAAFRASRGWVERMMKRSGFSLRRRTTICQKLPVDFEDKLVNFQRYVMKLLRKSRYGLGQICSADETPVYIEMPRTCTVNEGFGRQDKTILTPVMADAGQDGQVEQGHKGFGRQDKTILTPVMADAGQDGQVEQGHKVLQMHQM